MTETTLIWLAGLLFLWLPGAAVHAGLMRLGLRRFPDPLYTVAVQIGLGLALWPLLFLWSSTAGVAWRPGMARLVVLGLGGAGVAALFWVPRTRWRWRLAHLRRNAFWYTAWAALAVLTVKNRLDHIADLPLPNWVDPVHHTMILRIFVDGGTLPTTFAPFLPENSFVYHWGFHAIAAWLAWLLDWTDPFKLADLMLHFGQLLNSLTLLMVYAAGRTLFHSRRAGMLAAVLATLISWYPAFYVSWGRYTQLAGLLILAIFAVQLWQLHASRIQRPRGDYAAVILLGAGLVLVHVRVAFFGVTLGIVLVGAVVLAERWATLRRWAGAAVGVVVLAGPWLMQLLSNQWVQRSYAPVAAVSPNPGASGYNSIQWGLVWVPRSEMLFALATGGLSGLLGWGESGTLLRVVAGLWLAILLGLTGWMLYRQRRGGVARLWSGVAILWAWVGVTVVLLNLEAFGLPTLRFINNNAGVIALFAPLSLVGGGLLAWALGQAAPRRGSAMLTGLVAVGMGAWGAAGMTSVVNPVTTLARPADLPALAWVQENTPAEAHFAVRPWLWLGNTYAGVDGGYWLPILTDRGSVLPPALYDSGVDPVLLAATNDLLSALAQATDLSDPALRAKLSAAGVTHLYIGPRDGNSFQLDLLKQSPHARLLYEANGAAIFAYEPTE